MKSLERRLYDAYRAGRGIRFSAAEVADLVIPDDAVQARIANQLAREFGYEELGSSSLSLFGANGSIRAFRRELKESE